MRETSYFSHWFKADECFSVYIECLHSVEACTSWKIILFCLFVSLHVFHDFWQRKCGALRVLSKGGHQAWLTMIEIEFATYFYKYKRVVCLLCSYQRLSVACWEKGNECQWCQILFLFQFLLCTLHGNYYCYGKVLYLCDIYYSKFRYISITRD